MGGSPTSIERQKWADEARPPPRPGPNDPPITALKWLHLNTNDHLRKLLSDAGQPLGRDHEDNIASYKNYLADGGPPSSPDTDDLSRDDFGEDPSHAGEQDQLPPESPARSGSASSENPSSPTPEGTQGNMQFTTPARPATASSETGQQVPVLPRVPTGGPIVSPT
jgi:hypothetical protein